MVNGWTGERIDGTSIDGRTDGWDRRMADRRTDARTADGQTRGRTGGWKLFQLDGRMTDGRTDGDTDKRTDADGRTEFSALAFYAQGICQL